MPRRGYRQTADHKAKHLSKIVGQKNGNWKHGKETGQIKKWKNNYVWTPPNPQNKKNSHLKRAYGIGIEDYLRMMKEQDNRCAICGIESENLFVDHDHNGGEIRGLLCRLCNLGLGMFRDNPELLIKGSRYLESY